MPKPMSEPALGGIKKYPASEFMSSKMISNLSKSHARTCWLDLKVKRKALQSKPLKLNPQKPNTQKKPLSLIRGQRLITQFFSKSQPTLINTHSLTNTRPFDVGKLLTKDDQSTCDQR